MLQNTTGSRCKAQAACAWCPHQVMHIHYAATQRYHATLYEQQQHSFLLPQRHRHASTRANRQMQDPVRSNTFLPWGNAILITESPSERVRPCPPCAPIPSSSYCCCLLFCLPLLIQLLPWQSEFAAIECCSSASSHWLLLWVLFG